LKTQPVSKLAGAIVIVAWILFGATLANAQPSYTWNGGTAGSWSDAGSGWLDGATPTSWSNAVSTKALFSGTTPLNVTVSSVTAYGLQFAANNYVLSGGTLTLADPSSVGGTAGIISVGNSLGATINSVIAGSAGMSITGGGTLTLTGVNAYSGGTTVSAGTLNVFHNDNFGGSANAITLSGGTLQTSSTYSTHALAISSASTIDVATGFTTLQNAALTGSGTLTKTGGGTFFLGAGSGNTFSGNITLAVNGGTFQVGSSVSSSPAGGATLSSLTSTNTLTVNRGSTFTIQDNGAGSAAGYVADRIGSAGNRPAVSMNGGTFNMSGANNAAVMTQTLGTLTLASGASTINVIRTNGTPQLIFSSLNKTSGAFVYFFGSGTALGAAATNVPQILFSTVPTLVGGGGASGTTTRSILPGASYFTNELVTYDTNGARGLIAAEYNAVAGNNINGAGATENVKISNATPTAFVALSGPKTINALVVTAAASTTWAMGNTLTLTSGQFIYAPTVSILNISISSGVLTAGTGLGGNVDLDIGIASGVNGTITLGANLNNNGSTAVALVKNGVGGTLSLTNATDNTYSGGTFLNEGTLTTGATASRRYLGTGAVVVDNAGTLTLGAIGATSFSGSLASPTYTVKTGGQVQLADVAPAANEFFKIESGAVLTNAGTTSAGGLNISGPTKNLDAAFGAVFAETASGANAAIKNGAGVISSLTTPTYYFGLASTVSVSENVTVGAGAPWLGISNISNLNAIYDGTSGGANSTITANNDFTLQAPFPNGSLRIGATVGSLIRILTPNGNVNASIVGSVSLGLANCQYGSAGHTVTFQVTSGATLSALQANAMGVVGGAAIAPASIVVQNGGTLALNSAGVAGFNGNVTILPGGMFTQNQATLTGTGTFTHSDGSILNLTNTAAVSGATQALGTVAGTIVRLGITGLLPGTTTAGVTQFDSRLHDAAVYELTTNVSMGSAAANFDSLFTLSASGGIGGVLTNDASSRIFNGSNGTMTIGSGGGTFAATTGTTLTVSEKYALGANTLTIGSTVSYDGNPKLGIVSLNVNPPGLNSASAGSVISIINGATLQLVVLFDIPAVTRLNVNAGGTMNLNGFSDTVESITGAGAIVSSGGPPVTLAFSTTTTDANFSGTLSPTTAANLALTKTNSGTQTLSGSSANTYTGLTTLSGGTLILAKTSAIAVAGNLTIGDGVTTAGLDILQLGGTGGNQIADTSILTFNGTTTNAGIFRMNAQSETVGGLVSTGGAGIVENNTSGTSTLTLAVNTTNRDFAGILQNGAAGTLALSKSGTATQTLSGANTYTGTTTVSAGTLSASTIVVAGGSSNLGNATSAVVLGDGTNVGTLSYTGAADTYTRGFNVTAGSGGGGLTNTTGNLLQMSTGGTVVGSGATMTFQATSTGGITVNSDSVISGSGGKVAVNSSGAGVVTFSGANTYTGTTTVSAGTLKVTNTTGSGTGSGGVTVQSTGTLGGTGIVSGAVTVNAGGSVAPGGSPGTLTVGSTDFAPGSTLSIHIAGLTDSDADRSQLHSAAGALTFSGTSTDPFVISVIRDPSFQNLTTATYTIADFGSIGSTGLDAPNSIRVIQTGASDFATNGNFIRLQMSGFSAGDSFSLSRSGNTLQLSFTPVPEPIFVTCIFAAGLGGAGWLKRRGRPVRTPQLAL
jgi:fibronectin-binding autotransporter adhesin